VGALGLTQLMPGTARWLEPGTKASDLFDAEINLKMGFKYLRQLIDRYGGNRHLALTAYNRGPGTVERSLKKGRDPDNGYAATVLRNALRGVADSMGLGGGHDGPS
jgi:soluble lytic murein transglycosylase-like protein